MIGKRAPLTGLLSAVLAAGVVGPGGPDPSTQLGAERLVIERARAAATELAALEAIVEPALESARRGAARIVSGDEVPGVHLRTAAGQLTDAEATGRRAASAMRALDAARRARDPRAHELGAPVGAGEVSSIAAQLEATADAGDAFAETRRRAGEVTVALDRAFVALDVGAIADAREAVGESRAAFVAVEAWQDVTAALPVWLGTVDAMIGAVEMLVAATEAGDRERATRAAEAFDVAAADAGVADRALRIAISEGGSSLAAPALARLAALLAAVGEARAEVVAIMQAGGR